MDPYTLEYGWNNFQKITQTCSKLTTETEQD